MKKFGLLLIPVIFTAVLLMIAGCSTPQNALVGDWVPEDESEISISFQSDGSYIWFEEDCRGPYSILSDKTLVMTDTLSEDVERLSWTDSSDEDIDTHEWHISGDTLNLGGTVYTRSD